MQVGTSTVPERLEVGNVSAGVNGAAKVKKVRFWRTGAGLRCIHGLPGHGGGDLIHQRLPVGKQVERGRNIVSLSVKFEFAFCFCRFPNCEDVAVMLWMEVRCAGDQQASFLRVYRCDRAVRDFMQTPISIDRPKS